MQLERVDFVIDGFKAMELYSFTHKYFKVLPQNKTLF